MLFVLVMEVLNAIIHKAEALFTNLGSTKIKSRISLYADDVVVFVSPRENDLTLMRAILNKFAGATGLHTNLDKCQMSFIRCSDEDINVSMQTFPY
jgi:hypothetical protein